MPVLILNKKVGNCIASVKAEYMFHKRDFRYKIENAEIVVRNALKI